MTVVRSAAAVAVGLALAATAPAPASDSRAPQGKPPAPLTAPARSGSSPMVPVGADRVLTVTDATTLLEVRLAPPGQTTTLTFPVDVVAEKVVHTDPQRRLLPPISQGSLVVVTAKEAVAPGVSVPLTVTLVDGTQLNFGLMGSPGTFDRFVRVEVALAERAAAESAVRLKQQLEDVRARLDECVEQGPRQGVAKMAELILRREHSKDDTFTVEKRHYRGGIDKQSRLLVETQYVFRLFELTYLAILVENRDPGRTYTLDRAQVIVSGGAPRSGGTGAADALELDVEALAVEHDAIAPGDASKVVVAFRTPTLQAGQRFTLRLLEKNGSRHFELRDLSL